MFLNVHQEAETHLPPDVCVSPAELRVVGPLRWTNHRAGVHGGEERPHCIGSQNTAAAQGQLPPEWGAADDAEQGERKAGRFWFDLEWPPSFGSLSTNAIHFSLYDSQFGPLEDPSNNKALILVEGFKHKAKYVFFSPSIFPQKLIQPHFEVWSVCAKFSPSKFIRLLHSVK